jgi:uncharacterized membrane protein
MNKKNFAIAALVLGILAILAVIIFGAGWIAGILALAGGVLGFLGMKSEKKSLAIIGLVLSALVLVWVVIIAPIVSSTLGDISDALGG